MIFKNVFVLSFFYEYNKISKWKICNLYRWLYLPLIFTWRMGKWIFIDLHRRKELRCGECLVVRNSIPQLCWCPSQTQVRVQRLIKLEHLDLVWDLEHLQPLQHFSVKHIQAINHFICKQHDYILPSFIALQKVYTENDNKLYFYFHIYQILTFYTSFRL